MSLAWILLALATLLTAIAIYELRVSCEVTALADRLAAAMDGCETVWVRVTWRTWDAPWDLHCADLTLDCLPDLLADRPDLRAAIDHDTAWISFPTHPDQHHTKRANNERKQDR